MPLTHLPNEILTEIILHAMPEGFESMALTCKGFHALCLPYVWAHAQLRLLYEDTKMSSFILRDHSHHYPPKRLLFATAYELILHIANNPIVARYIKCADFQSDGLVFGWGSETVEEVYNRMGPFDPNGLIEQLLAISPYLKQAELHSIEYYEEIARDFRLRRYSPCATAFLFTLLPNVKMLSWPLKQQSRKSSRKLMEVVIRRAEQSPSPADSSGLAQVTTLRYEYPKLSSAFSIFPLLCYMMCKAPGTTSVIPGSRFLKSLRTLQLERCCSNDNDIRRLLPHIPHLEAFSYEHRSGYNEKPERAGREAYLEISESEAYSSDLSDSLIKIELEDWDICKFIMSIERKLGTCLVELSIVIDDSFTTNIVSGFVSMDGFLHVRKLRLPLEVVKCNIDAAADQSDNSSRLPELFYIVDLVQASVTILSLVSVSTSKYTAILETMFRDFKSIRANHWPNLEIIELLEHQPPVEDTDEFEDLDIEIKKQCIIVEDQTGWPLLPESIWRWGYSGDGGGFHFPANASLDESGIWWRQEIVKSES